MKKFFWYKCNRFQTACSFKGNSVGFTRSTHERSEYSINLYSERDKYQFGCNYEWFGLLREMFETRRITHEERNKTFRMKRQIYRYLLYQQWDRLIEKSGRLEIAKNPCTRK